MDENILKLSGDVIEIFNRLKLIKKLTKKQEIELERELFFIENDIKKGVYDEYRDCETCDQYEKPEEKQCKRKNCACVDC